MLHEHILRGEWSGLVGSRMRPTASSFVAAPGSRQLCPYRHALRDLVALEHHDVETTVPCLDRDVLTTAVRVL
jgi:hypothetical protein